MITLPLNFLEWCGVIFIAQWIFCIAYLVIALTKAKND